MPAAVLALTAGAFGIGTTEFLIMGLLLQVAADMQVSVSAADLNDWVYFDPQGNLAGGFTIAAVQNASRRTRRT